MKKGTQQFGPGLHELLDLGVQVNKNRHVLICWCICLYSHWQKMVQVKIERG
jgi:hypothetical protein